MRVKTVLGRQNYEHARVLTPMNVDIRANLRPVRESSGLPVPTGSSRVKILEVVAERVPFRRRGNENFRPIQSFFGYNP